MHLSLEAQSIYVLLVIVLRLYSSLGSLNPSPDPVPNWNKKRRETLAEE